MSPSCGHRVCHVPWQTGSATGEEEEGGYKEAMEKANVAKRLVQLLFLLRGEPSPSWQCRAGATGSALMQISLLCLISRFLVLIRAREQCTGLFVIREKQDVLRKQFFF